MSRRVTRLAAWATAVAGIAAGPFIARLDVAHAHAVAGAWTAAHLTAIIALLATTPRAAIRLPAWLGEAVVLGGAPLLFRGATGAWTPALVLAGALLIVGHVSPRAPFRRASGALGNPWRLAASLWHPALWLLVFAPPPSPRAWLAVAVVPAAQVASVLTRSPLAPARRAGWAAWVSAAIVTVAALW